ncbi:MAG: hypothetical protein P4L64_01830 [Caulobacteraceae bacterium]|nr:hypothetical protein [Caulobacteraceae bacterium]
MFSLPTLGFSLIFSLALCIHVVRTHREMYWLFIILAFPGIGGLIYLVAIVLPEMFGGNTARRISSAARETLDPERDYRKAKAAHEDSPTVGNAIRLASAAAALGRHAEAESLYAASAQGVHEDDPTLLLGRAAALVELNRFPEALTQLERLDATGDHGRTPQAALVRARALEGLGRLDEAAPHFELAAGRMPGMEALARYAAFLARAGRKDEAREQLAEIDRRIQRAAAPFRKEARAWRDLAAQAIG